jgi:hypothetical protein
MANHDGDRPQGAPPAPKPTPNTGPPRNCAADGQAYAPFPPDIERLITRIVGPALQAAAEEMAAELESEALARAA